MRTVLRGVVVLVLTAVLTACLSSGEPCACQHADNSVRYDIYLMTGFGPDAMLSPMEIRDDTERDPGSIAGSALLFKKMPPNSLLVNGWVPFEDSIAEVLSVTHADGEVVVDLDRSVMEPVPRELLAFVPDGRLTVQQLVWTVQQALGTDDPVRVTVQGRPTEGVWFTPVPWPVSADPSVLAPDTDR
jgi:hypothetical protein